MGIAGATPSGMSRAILTSGESITIAAVLPPLPGCSSATASAALALAIRACAWSLPLIFPLYSVFHLNEQTLLNPQANFP